MSQGQNNPGELDKRYLDWLLDKTDPHNPNPLTEQQIAEERAVILQGYKDRGELTVEGLEYLKELKEVLDEPADNNPD